MAEAKKKVMHEELFRRSTRIAVNKAVEKERSRKIELLTEMAEGRGSCLPEIAKSNANLVIVHRELKGAFKFVLVCSYD